MQWNLEDTAKHQSQEGWMACISYDAFIILVRHQGLAFAFRLWFNGHLGTKINCMLVLLLSLYQFSVMCFPLSDLFFSFHRKVVNAYRGRVGASMQHSNLSSSFAVHPGI